MMATLEKKLLGAAWTLAAVTTLLAVVVWGESLEWQLSGLSTYQIFPVLGLVAFGLMWGHYIVAALRLYLKLDRGVTAQYFHLTSLVVLAAILLHPGLLIWQLARDGLGLPPGSYYRLYGWLSLLGSVSLCIFLAFELRRKFGSRSWWKYVDRLNDLAMLAIYYHGFRLGTHTQLGWFVYVWYIYGLTLAVALGYIYYYKFKILPKTLAS